MASVIDAMKAKSDQLNFVDIGAGGELIIFIERVVVTGGNEQTVHVYYKGCENRPYKPSKGMIRLLAGAWGDDGDLWVGKSLKLFGDGTVTWAGGEVGGIRIAAMSHIDSAGYTAYIQKNRKTRVKQTIPLLVVEPVYYDNDRFEAELPAMVDAVKNGSMTIEDINAQCGLSPEQLSRLKND